MARVFLGMLRIMAVLVYTLPVLAQSPAEKAISLYNTGDYQQSAQLFEEILEEYKPSPALYFNLGNCYLRMGNLPRAILNYERALKIDPSYQSARQNLRHASNTRQEAVIPVEQFFLKTWYTGIQNTMSSNGWGILSLTVLWLGILLLCIRLLRPEWQLIARYTLPVGIIIVIFLVISLVFAYTRYQAETHTHDAVLMSDRSRLHIAPDGESQVLRSISGGEKVYILDTLDQWIKVQLANMEEGWLVSEDLERI